MRAGATAATGTSGQSYVKAVLEVLGWAAVLNPEHDLGTDLWVSPRDPRRFDLGLMLGAQVKNGTSHFSEDGEKDGRHGWWHRNDREHFEYWIHHAVQHILVLRQPETQQAYWVHINQKAVEWTGSGGKIFVPGDQLLDARALDALIDIAATARPAPHWAGSAWTGAQDLSEADALRYAMLAPRLVAPHPNAGKRTLRAHEAVALLTSGRFDELGRYDLLDQTDSRTGWNWDFFAALLAFVSSGTVEGLRACATCAAEPHEQAASAAALSAALIEGGAYDEALSALQAPLEADGCVPADHAWLEVHRARCLAELGEPAEAVKLAISVQALQVLLPDDVTAAAIVGSGAALVFGASGPFEGDVAQTVTSSDTETSWWRAQALSWGLGSMFDESFRRWARNDSEFRFGAGDPASRLRGVSLVDGFTALHDAWCHSTSLLAKWHLMSGRLSLDDAAGCLTDLRRAGDSKAIAVAVTRLFEDGPAIAVRRAAELVDLDRVTHTEAGASFELLIRGADVLTAPAADAAARWAMQDRTELGAWAERVRPTFIVDYRRADLLRALLPVITPAATTRVREFLVRLPQFTDQGDAHAWAAVIHSVPVDQWNIEQVEALLHRVGDHWELEHAIRGIGVQRDPTRRSANDNELRSGSIEALQWIGTITQVPQDAVAPLVTALAAQLRTRIAQVRGGMHAIYGGVDPGRVLVLLNTSFHERAEWEPIIELLREPNADTNLLGATVETIEAFAEKIDSGARTAIVDALDVIFRRTPPPAVPFLGGDPRPVARSALDALTPRALPPTGWLFFRDPQGRKKSIRSLALRADPSDTKTLIALAADPDTRIRATAAEALSYWVTKDVSTAAAAEALEQLLTDDGTLLARRVVSAWPDEPDERVSSIAATLVEHPSAVVRAAAKKVLDAVSGKPALP